MLRLHLSDLTHSALSQLNSLVEALQEMDLAMGLIRSKSRNVHKRAKIRCVRGNDVVIEHRSLLLLLSQSFHLLLVSVRSFSEALFRGFSHSFLPLFLNFSLFR